MNGQEACKVFSILRHGTVTVKIMPFALVVTYILSLVAYMFVSDGVQTWLDMMFYVSPMMVLSNLILSIVFKMCVWHRTECLLPLVPQCLVIVDIYIPLSEVAATVNVSVVCFMFLASVINAYFTFLRK